MKYLFIADLHINTRKKKVSEDWLINRYHLLMTKIKQILIENKIDKIILGGDIFDLPKPNLIELSIFYSFLNCFSDKEVILIAGNHEMLDKKLCTYDYLIDSLPRNLIYLSDITTLDGIGYVPYQALHNYDKYPENVNILVTHVRGAIPPHVKPEIDLSLLDKYQQVFAGDLHARSNSQNNIAYPGSPLVTTFHKKANKNENGIIVFDTENPKEYDWIDFSDLPQLLRISIDNPEDIVDDSYNWIDYELKNGSIKNTIELNNIKVVKSPETFNESLEGIKTSWDYSDIVEDVRLYLRKVKSIPDNKLSDLLELLNDTIEKTDLE